MAFHKRVYGRPFENAYRVNLYTEIERRPGVAFVELHDAFPVGYGALQHHLSVLEDNRLITSVKSGRYRRYYAQASGLANVKGAHARLMDPKFRRLYDLIRRLPGIRQNELGFQYGNVRHQSISYLVRGLIAVNLARIEPAGKATRIFALPEPQPRPAAPTVTGYATPSKNCVANLQNATIRSAWASSPG